MKKFKSAMDPNGLVASTIKKRPKLWDGLQDSDKDYIKAVVCAMKKTPGATVGGVANALINELSLAMGQNTMVRILKGLLNDKA